MCCCRSSTRRVTRERRHDRRRHRPDRVLEGVGPQRAAARGRGVACGDPRRRPHARRHRRDGDVHDRLERRARPHARARHPGGPVLVAHALRRRGREHHHAARGDRGRVGCGERGARVPRLQRAVGPALRSTHAAARARARSTGTRPFGIRTPAQMYSLWFRRYMDEFGATNEDFGRYTVVARRHAATNPNAWFYQRPITLDDHQQSRWIVEPVLRLLDCCQESDGGVALVVTSADRARDLPQPAVRIEAAADAHLGNGGVMYNYYHPDLAVFPEAEFLARQLWERSGLGPDDIDVAMLYENFSPIVFYQLEAFGFCKRGRGEGLHRRRQHRPRRRAARQHERRPPRRGLHPRVEQHRRRCAPGAGQRGEPGCRRRPRAGRGGAERPRARPRVTRRREEDGHDRCARRPEGARPVVGHRRADGRDAARRPRRPGHQDRAARR